MATPTQTPDTMADLPQSFETFSEVSMRDSSDDADTESTFAADDFSQPQQQAVQSVEKSEAETPTIWGQYAFFLCQNSKHV